MRKFFEELKRRNVFRETLGYLAAAWVLLEVGTVVLDTFDAPDWISQTLVIILAIGLPFWVLFSWAYQFTRKGLRRTPEETSSDVSPKNYKGSLVFMFLLAAAVGAGLVFAFQGIGSKIREEAQYHVAVLPFRDLSPDKDFEWYCDGMASSIRSKISTIDNLVPMAMSATRPYRNTDKGIPEIAGALGVQYLLEGEVRKYGSRNRITVNLMDAEGAVVWNREYDEPANAHAEVEEIVAKQIARSLGVYISREETGYIEKIGTENLLAWEAFVKGERIINDDHSLDSYQKAAAFFEEAIELDPLYAEAYANLAYCQQFELFFGWKKLELLDQSLKNVQTALRLDSTSVRGQNYMGNYYAVIKGDANRSLSYYEKALSRDPQDLLTLWDLAWTYRLTRPPELEQALKCINMAQEIHPFSDKVNWIKWSILFEMRDPEGLQQHFDYLNSLEDSIDSTSVEFLLSIGDIEAMKARDMRKKVKLLIEASEKDPANAALLAAIGRQYDNVFNDDEMAIQYVTRAYQLNPDRYINSLISLHLENGDIDKARQLMNTPEFMNARRGGRTNNWFFYHYYSGDYAKALQIVTDSMGMDTGTRYMKALALAGLGKKEAVNTMMRKISNKAEAILIAERATIYAAMGNRDSLYYYLNHPECYIRVNSRPMLDPYRKEPRYREWLRKNYLPQPEESEALLQ